MKPISSIKQADRTQGTGKLTYIGVAQSRLKLRILPSGNKDWVLRVATTIKQKRKQQVLHVAKFDKSQILDQVRMQATKLLNEHAQTSAFEGNNDKKVDLQLPSIWAEYINCVEYRENTAATQLQKKYSFQRYSKFWEAQGKSLITQVTRADVRAFQNSRKDKPVASNRDLSHMAHFIQFAVNEGYISENFARDHIGVPHRRVVNSNDTICYLPPSFIGFAHHGQKIYLNRDSEIEINPTFRRVFMDGVRGLFNSLKDHEMARYVDELEKHVQAS